MSTRPRSSSTRSKRTGLALAVLVAAAVAGPAVMLVTATTNVHVVAATVTATVVILLGARLRALLETLQREMAQQVSSQQERDDRRYAALMRHTTDVTLVFGDEGRVSYAGPAAPALFGVDPTGWRLHEVITIIHPSERRATLAAVLDRLATAGGEPARLNARLVERDGRDQFVDLVVVDLRDDPDVAGVVVTVQETTERTELERQLRHLAFHDPLTGLGNRELFQDRLGHALRRTRRSGQRLALLMCDLDDFKDVNDTLGHGAGDQMLVELARRLMRATRSADTIARIGGDEFAVLCEDIASTQAALTTARRLLAETREPVEVDGQLLRAGMSIGVVVDQGERNADELMRDADVALYEAKSQGKRRWALHRAVMTVRNQARMRMADDLARALASDQLDVAYQPIIDLAADRVVGVEALARWEHPETGAVAPAEFVAVAESTGLVTEIGHHVIDRALATAHRCIELGIEPVPRIGVNVSARQLQEPALIDFVTERLAMHDVHPSQLVMELTESSMLDDVAVTLSVMRRLRELGVRFAVDDFGTGYSSLSYLRRLPVDIVKIDRGFIDDLAEDPAAQDLVRAIIELGGTLALDVCAEGVETSAQRDLLVAMGCRFAQGYLFGRPMTADAMLATIAPTSRVGGLDDGTTQRS